MLWLRRWHNTNAWSGENSGSMQSYNSLFSKLSGLTWSVTCLGFDLICDCLGLGLSVICSCQLLSPLALVEFLLFPVSSDSCFCLSALCWSSFQGCDLSVSSTCSGLLPGSQPMSIFLFWRGLRCFSPLGGPGKYSTVQI